MLIGASARSGPSQTLEHGAVVGVRNKNKSTPLDLVSRCGHAKVAKVLLKHADASAHWQDKNMSTPLHLASQGGHIEVSLVLLEHGADENAKDENKWVPLHLGSRCGHVKIFHVLFKHGTDASAQDKNNSTPLHWASEGGHLEVSLVSSTMRMQVPRTRMSGCHYT